MAYHTTPIAFGSRPVVAQSPNRRPSLPGQPPFPLRRRVPSLGVPPLHAAGPTVHACGFPAKGSREGHPRDQAVNGRPRGLARRRRHGGGDRGPAMLRASGETGASITTYAEGEPKRWAVARLGSDHTEVIRRG